VTAPSAENLKIKVFADGADLKNIRELAANPQIKGFTTNPTLMRAAGVEDYKSFAHDVLSIIGDRPVSFEVFADDFATMEAQAREIASWGDNVYVKIPVTNTKGDDSSSLQRRLVDQGVQINVTALMTLQQVERVVANIGGGPHAFISVFAGRIADTGRDPVPVMTEALATAADHTNLELIWASPREVLNIVQADAIGCHVITVTHDLLKKLPSLGRDLDDFSLATVQMFHGDAEAAGYSL
jgi:transaldolase